MRARGTLDAEPLKGFVWCADVVDNAVLLGVFPVVCDQPLRPRVLFQWPVSPASVLELLSRQISGAPHAYHAERSIAQQTLPAASTANLKLA